MKTSSFLCFLVVCLCFSGAVQSAELLKIGILKFSAGSRAENSSVDAVEQMVQSVFVEEGRFAIVERKDIAAVDAERWVQEIRGIDGWTVPDELAAAWVVVGDVNNVAVTRKYTRSGPYYEADIDFGIKIIDVSTALVAYSEHFTTSESGFSVFKNAFADRSTSSGAFAIALKNLKEDVKRFVKLSFPVTVEIISVEKNGRKGEAKEVLISAGKTNGMEAGMELVVFQEVEITVGGDVLVRKKTIGEIKVRYLEGDNFAVCKVRSGGGQISNILNRGGRLKAEFLGDN
jgi:hypothetical protein